MRILVIDDTRIHRQAAQQTLAGHDLTVVGNYDEAVRQIKDGGPWDAVLSDLLMPASGESQGGEGEQYVGMQMPVGFALALLAALHGARYVGVVTATNHHHHPASAMLDSLGSAYWYGGEVRANFVINGAKAGFYHHPSVRVEGTSCPTCNGTKTGQDQKSCWSCEGTGLAEGKDWGQVLAALMRE